MNQTLSPKSPIQLLATALLSTRDGPFVMHGFGRDDVTSHVALVAGKPANGCLVRIHSACLTGDIFGSRHCDCGEQWRESMRRVAEEACGILIYQVFDEGRGHGLTNKIKAYALQEKGLNTIEADQCLGLPVDERNYRDAATILHAFFRLTQVRLLTNNPDKIAEIEKADIRVERVDFWPAIHSDNEPYITAKRDHMGHLGLT